MNDSVIIIGGGMGGLFTGALLARNGYRVTVLEKNATIGGGLQTFLRAGQRFETGMHMLGGFRPGASIFRICHYLGILDQLQLRATDNDCMDSLYYLRENERYAIPCGPERFVAYFSERFPTEAPQIRQYVEALYRLSNEVGMFYLREEDRPIFAHDEAFLQPADEFIAHYIKDPRLQDILAYMNPMYGGVAHHTPAYIHALVNVLYINGEDRFVDGSSQLAYALADVIRQHQGQVLTKSSVRTLACENRTIRSVETENGTRYTADHYISAIHPCTLLRYLDASALPRAYRQRLEEIPNSYSAFTVYLTLKPNRVPYFNHTGYCQSAHGLSWQLGLYDDQWPRGVMYMTPPVRQQGPFSRKMILTSPMPFEAVRSWENTRTGHRGPDYEAWKQRQADRILDRMEQIYPHFRDHIEALYTSSPLTIRDYYGAKEGSMYGFRKDAQNIALSQVPIVTKIRNLWLTGQNINLHGICGVPLTAINTAEALMGSHELIRQINAKYEADFPEGPTYPFYPPSTTP